MTTYTDHPDALFDPDQPILSSTHLEARDNLVALAEGDPTAPKIKDLGLDTTATNDGRNWVLARIALSAPNQSGTYALLKWTGSSSGSKTKGDTAAGSNFQYASANGDIGGGSPTGTWMCYGYSLSGAGTSANTSIWMKI